MTATTVVRRHRPAQPQVVQERIADFDQQMGWLAGWGSTLEVRSDPHAVAERIKPVAEGVEAAATRRGEYRKVALEIAYYQLDPLFYGLLAYTVTREKSLEAGIKYLILAAASSAFLIFGMALVYAQTGRRDFASISLFNAV